MDGAAYIGMFREETVDEVTPYLWSDELILRYLTEAQTAFCRETEGVEDQLVVTVAAGSATVRLPAKVRKIRAARLEETPRELELMSVEEVGAEGTLPVASGVPRVLVMGGRAGMVQVVPVPLEDTRIVLDVFRLPNERIGSTSDELEVDDMYATDLLHYMLYRAYSRPDPDTMDRVRADYFREQFDLSVLRARREQGRRRKPNGATQFSW